MTQSTVSKPVSKLLFHYLVGILGFWNSGEYGGGGYDLRVALTRHHPLEAHLFHAVGQQGVEP